MAIDLRPGLRRAAGREFVENAGQRFRRQVLVIIGIDLHHRRVDAGGQTFHLGPREGAVGGHLVRATDPIVQQFLERVGAAQHARRGAAELNVETPDRRQIEHRVEGRDLEHADLGHAEHVGDKLDGLLRQPAARLLLRAPQKRNHRRLLSARRIFGDPRLRPLQIFRRESKTRRLLFGKAADAHRSTSPNTTSSEPRIADMSASMCPRERKSIAWRCANEGARILHLYGRLVPSDTRYTPNSPLGASTAAYTSPAGTRWPSV